MKEKKTTTAVILVPFANIRKEPNMECEVKKVMKAGEKVNVIEKTGDFYKLTIGYIRSDLVSLEE